MGSLHCYVPTIMSSFDEGDGLGNEQFYSILQIIAIAYETVPIIPLNTFYLWRKDNPHI